jgi:hypothetical protein
MYSEGCEIGKSKQRSKRINRQYGILERRMGNHAVALCWRWPPI